MNQLYEHLSSENDRLTKLTIEQKEKIKKLEETLQEKEKIFKIRQLNKFVHSVKKTSNYKKNYRRYVLKI